MRRGARKSGAPWTAEALPTSSRTSRVSRVLFDNSVLSAVGPGWRPAQFFARSAHRTPPAPPPPHRHPHHLPGSARPRRRARRSAAPPPSASARRAVLLALRHQPIRCRFGNATTNATVVSDTALECPTPAPTAVATVPLLLDAPALSPSPLVVAAAFSYYNDTSTVSSATPSLATRLSEGVVELWGSGFEEHGAPRCRIGGPGASGPSASGRASPTSGSAAAASGGSRSPRATARRRRTPRSAPCRPPPPSSTPLMANAGVAAAAAAARPSPPR